MGLRRRDKASIINFRRPNIINGLLRVQFCANVGGLGPENRMIGFVSAGNPSPARRN